MILQNGVKRVILTEWYDWIGVLNPPIFMLLIYFFCNKYTTSILRINKYKWGKCL